MEKIYEFVLEHVLAMEVSLSVIYLLQKVLWYRDIGTKRNTGWWLGMCGAVYILL